MKFTELKNDIAEGARHIYLLEGDDAYFRGKAEEQIKTAFLTMPELNYTSFDGSLYKGANLSEITSACLSFPFMAERRIIKITDFYPSESDYEKYLKSTFENFPDSAIAIIVNSQSKKGVDLKRKKCITYIDCNHADGETVTKWAYITLKRSGVIADVAACEAIAAYCLNDMARVSKEVEKLIALRKDKIVLADVDELIYKDADYRIYEMTNAISRRNYGQFTEIANDLLSKGFDENALLASMLNYFKNLLTVLTSDKSDAELASALKSKDWAIKKSREQAQAVGKAKLIKMTGSLYSLQSGIKNGNISARSALSCAMQNIFFG